MTPHLLIYSPAASGLVYKDHASSLVSLTAALIQAGVPFTYANAECSDIVVGRATAVRMLLDHPAFTHLLFLDVDLEFRPADAIVSMLQADVPVVAGAYPCRGPNPIWMCHTQENPPTTVEVPAVAVGTVFSSVTSTISLIPASHVPTGFMLLQRGVIERLVAAHQNLHIRAGFRGETDSFLFFDARPSLSDPHLYVSDDYGFCELWRPLGPLYIYPDVTFRHYYTTCNEGNFGAWLRQVGEAQAESPAA